MSASASTLFFSDGSPSMQRLDSSAPRRLLTRVTRPGCWISILPTDGMILLPEATAGCVCSDSLQTSLGFVGSPESTVTEVVNAVPRTESIAPARLHLWLLMALHVAGAAGTYVLSAPAALGFDSPATLTLLRAAIAAVVLAALTGWIIPRPRFNPREWLWVIFFGFLLVPLNQYTFLRGMRHTAPGHPPLLYALTPLGVLLLGSLVSRRWPSRGRTLGVLIAFAGVTLLLRPWDESAVAHELRLGDLWVGAAVLAWVVYTWWARQLCVRHDPRTVTAWSLITGTVWMLPGGLPGLWTQDWGALSGAAWLGLTWVALVTSVTMMLIWNILLRHLEPVEVAICANAQPPATALIAALLVAAGLLEGTQDFGALFWLGMALILAGVLRVQTSAR